MLNAQRAHDAAILRVDMARANLRMAVGYPLANGWSIKGELPKKSICRHWPNSEMTCWRATHRWHAARPSDRLLNVVSITKRHSACLS